MNYVISVINPKAMKTMELILKELNLPLSVELFGKGTAVQSMLDLLDIETSEKRVVITLADADKTKALLRKMKNKLFIGVPGHGIVVTVPVKSIGGISTVRFLTDNENGASYTPEFNYDYELIVAIANEGLSDKVMNAAREAGATGGTVMHGKGTGGEQTPKFLNVTIASEKEVILIVSRTQQKSEIMSNILKKAGPQTEAGTVVFSLPIGTVAGFGLLEGTE